MPHKKQPKDKLVGTIIDVTPKWVALCPLYCEWIDSGTREQKQLKDELLKLCKVADVVNEDKVAKVAE